MKGSPFTLLCRQYHELGCPPYADLHIHTHFSDGTYSPEDVISRSMAVGLRMIAVTDHDTMDSVGPTQRAAGDAVVVIPGVEISAELDGADIHILGYDVDVNDPDLRACLDRLRLGRRRRVLEMADRLAPSGAAVADGIEAMPPWVSLGRRHLARLLVQRGHAVNLRAAFVRWLNRPELHDIPRPRVPAAEAITLIRQAGGVAAWAHPPGADAPRRLSMLTALGIQAIECVYPWPSRRDERIRRAWAERWGLAITGGSDCHEPGHRDIGCRAIARHEVDKLRACGQRGSRGPVANSSSPIPFVPTAER